LALRLLNKCVHAFIFKATDLPANFAVMCDNVCANDRS
jgi:hypothetical protein